MPHPSRTFPSPKGFTLVEMSIVLVIIGVIVAGVAVGAEMIANARTRAVVTQLQQYEAAVATFREKYKATPGDMMKATQYLGAAAHNGDGNDRLDDSANIATPGNNTLAASFSSELLWFWQDLSLAGLIGSGYDGATVSTNGGYPITKLKKGGIVAMTDISVNVWVVGVNTILSGGNYTSGNGTLTFGSGIANTGANLLTPSEAYSIDNKMDDGTINTGMVIHVTGHTTNALTLLNSTNATGTTTCWATTPTNAVNTPPTPVVEYRQSNTTNSCTLRVVMQN